MLKINSIRESRLEMDEIDKSRINVTAMCCIETVTIKLNNVDYN